MVEQLILQIPTQAYADTGTLCTSQPRFAPQDLSRADIGHQIINSKRGPSPPKKGEPACTPHQKATTKEGTTAGRLPSHVSAKPQSTRHISHSVHTMPLA